MSPVLSCSRCYFMATESHFVGDLCAACAEVASDADAYEVEPDKPKVKLDHTKPGRISRTVHSNGQLLNTREMLRDLPRVPPHLGQRLKRLCD